MFSVFGFCSYWVVYQGRKHSECTCEGQDKRVHTCYDVSRPHNKVFTLLTDSNVQQSLNNTSYANCFGMMLCYDVNQCINGKATTTTNNASKLVPVFAVS